MRSILPSLTKTLFKGSSEHLEMLAWIIDPPRLNRLYITFFNAEGTGKGPHIAFSTEAIIVKFLLRPSEYGVLGVHPMHGVRMVAFIPRVGLHLVLASCFHVGTPLYLRRSHTRTKLAQDDIENTLWLDLLRSFVAVKNPRLSEEFVSRIAPAVLLKNLSGQERQKFCPP